MQAIEITKPGDPSVLISKKRAVPIPGYHQVLIKVAFAGVNRPDVLQRSGLYKPPPGASDLPGLEASGTVVALGGGVSSLKVGDAVCALLPGGGYAEYAVTNSDHCLPVPKGFTMQEAACLPETYFTVWSNVFQRGGLQAGERFLVHGGSSGIGTTAIQLASVFGARVFATAGSDHKCQACRNLGAEIALNYKQQDFVEVLCKEGGADVILDMVGGDYIPRNIKSLALGGRLVQIAFVKGAKIEVNFAEVMTRRLTITGSTLRPQSDLAKAQIANSLRHKVWPLIEQGRLKTVLDNTYDLKEASRAHARMESSAHIGKIVLKVS